jgi:SAM-dependent methyltransferase
MSLVEWMDQRLYPEQGDNWDDSLFRREVLKDLRPDDDLLDLGAGAGIVTQMDFRGFARRICGVDPDERVVGNPYLDEGKVGVGEAIPYEDASFDVVIADNVLEHLAAPEAVFSEVARVLKPGGRFLVKTPNKWHYMPVIARLTPTSFHRFVIRVRRSREMEDVFPTRYRVNSRRALRHYAELAGLRVRRVIEFEGRPEYLRVHPVSYAFGSLYERLVNRWRWLSPFRVLLVAALEKPGALADSSRVS